MEHIKKVKIFGVKICLFFFSPENAVMSLMTATSFLHLLNLLSTGRVAVQRHVFSELTVVMICLDLFSANVTILSHIISY